MKSNLLLLLASCSLLTATGRTAETAAPDPIASETKNYPITLGLEIGTTGAGGTAAWRFSEHLGVRAGAHYFDYSYDYTPDDQDAGDNTFGGSLLMQNQEVGLDIFPWKNRSFRITIGAFFNQNELEGLVTGEVEINDVSYTVSAADPVRLGVEYDPVNPFITVGGNLFYFDKAHRWALFYEIGVVYTGDPEVSLTGPAIIPGSELAAEQKKIEDALSDLPFWPIAKIGLSVSF